MILVNSFAELNTQDTNITQSIFSCEERITDVLPALNDGDITIVLDYMKGYIKQIQMKAI